MDEELRYSKEAPIDEYTNKLVSLACEIAGAANKENKKYFFSGGLAIDFSLGKITRNHHDIDFHPMLEDTDWWIEWFKNRGLRIKPITDSDFPETYKVKDENGESILDLWPLKFDGDKLVIKYKGNYVESGKLWDETKVIDFQGVAVRIENPMRVLEHKTRHVKMGQPFRSQDLHDFELLGQKHDGNASA